MIHYLQACNAQVGGYWDEDEFYETITFTQLPQPELTSSSLGISPGDKEGVRWLQLKFALMVNPTIGFEHSEGDAKTTLGELILILDENLEVIDENWLIDVTSPYVLATQ
ncbi:MAG: hypothetical protein HC866_20870 [Leptolyngbyaceae cyanobacterium RU_5_1]|nr:hypothetical protein [Leptolyngbyaceae cyanobacterium RU_5_1]